MHPMFDSIHHQPYQHNVLAHIRNTLLMRRFRNPKGIFLRYSVFMFHERTSTGLPFIPVYVFAF